MNAQTTITPNRITTDDISFSAWLRMRGYPLININHSAKKSIFQFALNGKDADTLKMEFINSEFITYYNELRNLKKLI